MPRRLVLIEGLSGSGKTTTALQLVERLRRHGVEARAYHESDDENPIQIGQLLPNIAEAIDRYTRRTDFLRDWSALAARVEEGAQTIVLESRLIQNAAMFVFLAGRGERALEHTVEIVDCIKGVDPLLIYLRSSDPVAHAQRALDESPPEWVALATSEFGRTPWLRARGLDGSEGWVEFFRVWGPQVDAIVAALDVDVLTLTDAHLDWQSATERIVHAVLGS